MPSSKAVFLFIELPFVYKCTNTPSICLSRLPVFFKKRANGRLANPAFARLFRFTPKPVEPVSPTIQVIYETTKEIHFAAKAYTMCGALKFEEERLSAKITSSIL
jgi:hypothetical protein